MNALKYKPEVVIFAGPNGSGKSTFTKELKPQNIPYINADEIAATEFCDVLSAAKKAERLREKCLTDRLSFSFETVLSTNRNIDLLARAKDAGYFIRCFYVLTYDPDINITRVASRVQEGGHDVPTDKIVKRYYRCLELIKMLVPLCDVCHIYDNSDEKPYRIFKKRKEQYFYSPKAFLWLKEDITLLTGIDNPVRAALNKC